MKTAIDALERMSRMLFNYHDGAPVKVEDLQVELKTTITALKSLEGPRLTVDEAMDGLRKWMYENKWRLCGMHSYEHPFTADQFTSIREALTKSANP